MDPIITPPPDEASRRQAFLQVLQDWATLPFPVDGLPGIPYLWGGKDPDFGLDCSGCVTAALEAIGMLPLAFGLAHNATSLHALWGVPADPTAPQPGDLAFYGPHGTVDHVMVVLSATEVIGASGGGSNCTDLATARRIDACVHVRSPYAYRSDLVGFRVFPWGSV